MSGPTSRTGLVHGVLAYALWGVVPLYWRLVAGIDPVELTAHRGVWSFAAFVLVVLALRQWAALRTAARDLRTLALIVTTGVLLALNWGLFVWATVSGHLLEASLGYFINPLISVALGMMFLRERLRRLQWIAIASATIGVGVMTWRAGGLPWVALVLSITWGCYGLLRKIARVDALVGTTLETIVLAPLAVGYLVYIGGGELVHAGARTDALLVGTGLVTAVPLVLFASAARQLPLSTVGFLQYLAPTGQFILAVTVFGEPISHARLVAFGWIWAGLGVFMLDLVRTLRPARR